MLKKAHPMQKKKAKLKCWLTRRHWKDHSGQYTQNKHIIIAFGGVGMEGALADVHATDVAICLGKQWATYFQQSC